jgi:hypothetical protein
MTKKRESKRRSEQRIWRRVSLCLQPRIQIWMVFKTIFERHSGARAKRNSAWLRTKWWSTFKRSKELTSLIIGKSKISGILQIKSSLPVMWTLISCIQVSSIWMIELISSQFRSGSMEVLRRLAFSSLKLRELGTQLRRSIKTLNLEHLEATRLRIYHQLEIKDKTQQTTIRSCMFSSSTIRWHSKKTSQSHTTKLSHSLISKLVEHHQSSKS